MQRAVMLCILSALLSLCIVSCTEEDGLDYSENVGVQFTSSLSSDGAPATRVYDQTWTCNEKIGVAMVKAGSTAAPTSFAEYKSVGTAGATKVDFEAVGTTGLYYPLSPDDKVNFIAYSPYSGTSTATTVTYNNMHQQNGDRSVMESKDFIYHKGDTPYSCETTDKVGLLFTHKFSKIVVNVSRATGVTELMSSLEVTIDGIPQSATCSLADGSLSRVGTKATLTPWRNTNAGMNDAEHTTFEAIVAPHAGSRTITFTVKNGTTTVHTYTKKIDDEFLTNTRYIYNYKVTATGVALSGSSVSDWGTHTTTNDAYYLTVSDKLINVGSSGITDGILFIRANSSPVTVMRSNSPDKITDSGVTWLSITEFDEGVADEDGTPYLVIYSTSAHTGSASRSAYLWIQVNELTLIVEIRQEGRVALPANDANCYIVPPGSETVTIPVARAKYYSQVYDANHPSLGANEAFTAEVLWSDVPDLIYSVTVNKNGAEGSFVVTTNPWTAQGNAVVAIRNASGHILWSWHIWVTNTPSDVPIGNEPKKFMDRNLGALNATPQDPKSLGLLYQWGRKDPFTGASVFTLGNPNPAPVQLYMNGDFHIITDHPIVAHTNNISITGSIAQPHTFFAGSDDWAPATEHPIPPGKSGLRWGPEDAKALDDPCPAGYKVPTITQLEDGVGGTDAAAWNLGHSVDDTWWPTTGFRESVTGRLLNVGTDTGYWGCRTSEKYGAPLIAHTVWAVTRTNGSPSNGLNVRCVSQQ